MLWLPVPSCSHVVNLSPNTPCVLCFSLRLLQSLDGFPPASLNFHSVPSHAVGPALPDPPRLKEHFLQNILDLWSLPHWWPLELRALHLHEIPPNWIAPSLDSLPSVKRSSGGMVSFTQRGCSTLVC